MVETNWIIPQMVVWWWFTNGRKLLTSLCKNITSGKFHPRHFCQGTAKAEKAPAKSERACRPQKLFEDIWPHLGWHVTKNFSCNLIASIKFVAWIGRVFILGEWKDNTFQKYNLDRKPPGAPATFMTRMTWWFRKLKASWLPHPKWGDRSEVHQTTASHVNLPAGARQVGALWLNRVSTWKGL